MSSIPLSVFMTTQILEPTQRSMSSKGLLALIKDFPPYIIYVWSDFSGNISF